MTSTGASVETPGRTGETGCGWPPNATVHASSPPPAVSTPARARRLHGRHRPRGGGKATLSRRFADPGELISAVFADRMDAMDAYAAAVTASLADSDPWHGFTSYVQAVCAMQAANRGFADVLTMTFPAAIALETRRTEAYEGFLKVVTRARATGYLREDFTSEDLVILLMANAGVSNAAGDAAPDAWRHLVAHMLRSYAVPGAPLPPLPEAPAPAALDRAMVHLSRADST